MAYPVEVFRKGPAEVLDYAGDWAAWLVDDTITASTWTVPTGLTADGSSFGDTSTTVWLSGGELGADYDVENCIETAGGRTACRTIRIQVRPR